MALPALTVLQHSFTIHRLPPQTPLPDPLLDAPFCWIGRTDEELSIVCEAGIDLPGSERSDGWSCIKIAGPLDLSLTGVLSGIAVALAAAEVGIFVLSTFDTDYILVQTDQLPAAVVTLGAAGYAVTSEA